MISMVVAFVYLALLVLSFLLTFGIAVAWLILKPPAKDVCGNVLIVVASVCAVVGMLSQPVSDYIQSRHEMNVRQYLRDENAIVASKADAIANSIEKAESVELVQSELPFTKPLVQFLALPTRDESSTAVRAFFKKLSTEDGKRPSILYRHLIFEHEFKAQPSDKISNDSSTNQTDVDKITKLIRNVESPISASQVEEDTALVIKTLPDGFYRYSLLKAIYKSAGDTKHLQTLTIEHQVRVRQRMQKMLTGIALSYTFILVGIIVLIVLAKTFRKAPIHDLGGEPIPAIPLKRVYCFGLVVYFAQFCLSFPFGMFAAMVPGFASILQHETVALTTITLGANMVLILLCAHWVIFKPLGIDTVTALKKLFRGNLLTSLKLGSASFCAVKALVALFYWIVYALMQKESSTNNPVVDQIRMLALDPSVVNLLLITLSVAVFAPIAEEFAFRGLLYTSLKPKARVIGAVLLSGAIFAAYHMDPGSFIGLFGVGIGLAYLYERSRSLLSCVVMHALWNSTFVLLAWLLT